MSVPDINLDAVQACADRACHRLAATSDALAAALTAPAARARVGKVVIASEFATDVFLRQPQLLLSLLDDDGVNATAEPLLAPERREDWPTALRRYRQAESARLIWRDVHGLDTLDQTLAAVTELAERCLQWALSALEREFTTRYGVVHAHDGAPVRLVVFALGKLGGGELNFSSDVDLVYAYEAPGETRTEGATQSRTLTAEDYFARMGQQLAKLLDETTADGFCHRVDLRLRPFGSAGRIALSFAAMEQYFQREGRDWERYAWQKARPVAGDLQAGTRFLETLRPFVYRRYLDYGALDGLRGMKATIAAEVDRKDLADDIKRGPGGIREIEFMAQAMQLIRGGREPALRERRLQPALRALCEAQHLDAGTTDALLQAYRFLRLLENRLQMFRDAQTQRLPSDALECARIAHGLGDADWQTTMQRLQQHRQRVAVEFEALLAPQTRDNDQNAVLSALTTYWRGLPEGGDTVALREAGFEQADEADQALRDFVRAPGVRDLSDASRTRLDRLLPALLAAVASSSDPTLALRRLLAVLHPILRRTSYLALLDERPAAMTRLVDVLSRSALLGDRLARHPLLLDELLDSRMAGPPPGRDDLREAYTRARMQSAETTDTESMLLTLNELRQMFGFRVALAMLDGRMTAAQAAQVLAWLADVIVDAVMGLAADEMRDAHGTLPGARFVALGYGSLGGQELGFGSDLDLVFVFDAPVDAMSDGARPLDAPRWSARFAQKIVSLLSAPTGAGRLYEVDVRLRPDGVKGLLVSTLASFEEYQRQRAWTWEHQALVRTRCVSGDAALCAEFERIRTQTLGSARDPQQLREDVIAMRLRMRAELDRSDGARFDLKQGDGGLIDLEFLLQYLVLRDAHAQPNLLLPRETPALIDAAATAGLLDEAAAQSLRVAHECLLRAGLACTLDRRQRVVVPDASVQAARQAVRDACRALDLRFEASTAV